MMMEDAVGKAASQAAAASGHILLFEDDDTLAALLARVLRTEGYHVDVARQRRRDSGPAKLATYDVVLSDIHLADDTSGHDVLKRVRGRRSDARPSS